MEHDYDAWSCSKTKLMLLTPPHPPAAISVWQDCNTDKSYIANDG